MNTRLVGRDRELAELSRLRVLEQGRDLGLSPALLEMGDGPPAAERFLAVERVVRALLAAAEPDGLVVALDDLQWADDASLRLLRHACGELAGARMLLLLARCAIARSTARGRC